MMPPKPGPPPRQVPRERVLRRRLAAVGGALVVLLVVYGIVELATGTKTANAPTTTAAVLAKPFRIVFPEGFSRREMAHRVQVVARIAQSKHRGHVRFSQRTYLAATHARRLAGFGAKRRPLEGFLFPATYDFLAGTTSAQLVQKQLSAFADNWSQVASMVEKEALAPDERPLIAAVIYNRLHDRMPLGIDATIRYGLNVPGTQSLRESQLQSNNPYNTRKFPGLPPTPIANPGLASMQAAAHPTHVDYLYFVRKPDKVHHYFTKSFNDFVNHERQYGY